MGYSPRGGKELDTTVQLCIHAKGIYKGNGEWWVARTVQYVSYHFNSSSKRGMLAYPDFFLDSLKFLQSQLPILSVSNTFFFGVGRLNKEKDWKGDLSGVKWG